MRSSPGTPLGTWKRSLRGAPGDSLRPLFRGGGKEGEKGGPFGPFSCGHFAANVVPRASVVKWISRQPSKLLLGVRIPPDAPRKRPALRGAFSCVYASVSAFTKEEPLKKEPFRLVGRVEAALIASTSGDHVSVPAKKIQVIRGHGVRGDGHAGVRLADVRERELLAFGFPKGIEIANHREFSAVSAEELGEIAEAMGVPSVPYGCLGENLVLSGIPRLTALPVGTLLLFRKPGGQPRTAALAVWRENMPCLAPGEAIWARHPHVPRTAAALFPKAASGRRGVVGSVYCSGVIHAGDEVVAMIPSQHIYDPA